MRSGYTVFVIDALSGGTTHVTHHRAATPEAAASLAVKETAKDWDMSDAENLHVLGIVKGKVEIIEWNDLDE